MVEGRTKFERVAPVMDASVSKLLEQTARLRRLCQRGAEVSPAHARAVSAAIEVIASELKAALEAET